MYRGPNLQQDLQSLIIKWRQYKYAYTADIEKMFRKIWVSPLDQSYQKILWRDNQNQSIKEYQLATVTYGTKSAPFLAMMTLKQLAQDERDNYVDSLAPEALEGSFYMDDLLHGSHSIESAKKLQEDLIKLLQAGGFNLRKWKANSTVLLEDVSCDQENFDFKQVESTKTLGLGWNPRKDKFLFQSKITHSATSDMTKREFLSEISKLYDPLGWISPLTIKLKILFQDVWKTKIQWDEPIPTEIKKEWDKIKNDIIIINEIEIPRWLQTRQYDTIELHGFSDASTKAYACVIYCKIKRDQDSSVVLVAGKTKLVSVNKNTSLPRLELSGAVLLSKLMTKIKTCLNNYNIMIFGWVDSMAVLGWLNGEADKWKPFVANRVKQVTAVMPPNCWQYIKSKENPADCATRGLTAAQLKDYGLWWQGPAWLRTYEPDQEAGKNKFITNLELKKCKQVNVATVDNTFIIGLVNDLIQKYSSINKVIRIFAWINRIICRKNTEYLSVDELTKSRNIIIKLNQASEFCDEINCLRKGQPLNKSSKILSLNPLLDKDGLLRVGGRLRHANMDPEMKHPLIIPNNRLAELIIDQAHETTFHGGAKLTISFIRQKYWLLGGNRIIKKRLRLCVTCKRQNPKRAAQMMGDLPPSRVNPSRPFFHTGIDYTGHFYIKANKGRGIKTTKGYVAVFICMTTKAVHLELVSDMTSSTFLAALRRLAARRGTPGHLYSDQGTNFIGANKILQQEYADILKSVNQQECKSEIAKMGINWHFNAPSWPSAGGLWEAAVKSLKYHLKRVIGEQRLTYEEFSTLITQIEGCLNSRPLCPLSDDPEELDALTPSHFLGSGPLLTIHETEKDLRTRWQLVQKIISDVWERWRHEYLTQLSVRSKWRQPKENIKIGDVVVIQDDNIPPGQWALGKVVQLHPGSDQYVRVVTLKTKNGFIKRPIIKLSILYSSQDDEKQHKIEISQENQEIKTSKQSKNKPISFSKIVMSLLLFLMVIAPASPTVYNITSLQNNNSLYFDSITNMHLIRDQWRLVVYYDTQPYHEGNVTLRKYIDYLEKICPLIKTESHCTAIILQLWHGFKELQHNNNILMNYQTNTNSRQRKRRGLINGIGYVANSLFGVLDEQFAEKYEKDIATIRSNEHHLAALWKNQTSVVEAEFNLLKRTKDTMEHHHKLIHQKINNIENSLNQINEGIQNLSLSSDFIETAMIANNILFSLRNIQVTLLDTITNIYNGKFNFQLLSPEQLRHELNIISGQLPKDLSSPIDSFNLADVYNLLQVRTRMSLKYLIIEIKIPLIGRDMYEIYRLIPLPYLIGNQTTTLVPIAEYAAINLKKDALIPVSESDLKQCTHQNINLVLCYLRKPIYHIKDDQNLCERLPGTRICKSTTSSCANIWRELNKLNEYFYFCCDQCHMKLLCEDQVTAVQLTGNGLFTINAGCIIKSAEFLVFAHRSETSKIMISSKIEAPRIAPINHIIKTSVPTSVQLEDMTQSNKQLQEIREQIDIMKENTPIIETVSTHDVHHYATIYIIMAVMLLTAIIYVVKRVRVRGRSQVFRQAAADGASEEQAQAGTTAAAAVRLHTVSSKVENQCSKCTSVVQCGEKSSGLSEVVIPPKTPPRLPRASTQRL